MRSIYKKTLKAPYLQNLYFTHGGHLGFKKKLISRHQCFAHLDIKQFNFSIYLYLYIYVLWTFLVA